jgi:hypothetical protein
VEAGTQGNVGPETQVIVRGKPLDSRHTWPDPILGLECELIIDEAWGL